jgi:hypothetical protein
MSESLQFIYKEEFWFISAFINTTRINTELKSKEIENLIKKKFQNLKDEDIYKKELKEALFELIRNISIKCSWVTCLSNNYTKP